MRAVKLSGVEFHWSRPFVTIKNRVQIGMNLGGGVASTKGTIDETLTFETTFTNPVTGAMFRDVRTDTANVPASDILYGIVPLIKVEAQGAVIVHPSLKFKVAGGLNMPSASSVRISAVYLIGAK